MGQFFESMAVSILDHLSIISAAAAHPETIIDNTFLESLDIGTSNEWIMERVGIVTRRTILPLDYIKTTRNVNPLAAKEAANTTLTQLGKDAALKALQYANIQPQDVGLVILGMSIPEMYIPANACLIANELGIEAKAFDLNSACSSFMAHLHFINSMKQEALPEYILLIQAEIYTTAINYNDRNSAVLFGDAASAQVLSPRRLGKGRIQQTSFDSDPSSWNKIYVAPGAHFVQQGSTVQRFAIQRTVSTAEALIKDYVNRDSLYFIGHQANLRMLESSCARLQIDPSKHFYNVDRYGNCGGAGAPSVLAEKWYSFKKGDTLVTATVGAGLSWGGSLIYFGDDE